MALVTLDQAKGHLNMPLYPGVRDDDLELKLAAAEAIILDYLETQTPDAEVLPIVAVAIMLQFGELCRFRGDDTQGPQHTDGQLSTTITNYLRRIKPVAVA